MVQVALVLRQLLGMSVRLRYVRDVRGPGRLIAGKKVRVSCSEHMGC